MLGKSGIIPSATDENGFNPALFFQMYLDSTNPRLDRLFQRAQRKSKKFNLHDFSTTCLFEAAPVGKNTIAQLTKSLCKAAGEPENWTNHCLRATGISTLKRLGYEDRAIVGLTGKFLLSTEISSV